MEDLRKSVNDLVSEPSGGYISIIRMQMVREHGCLYGKERLRDMGTAAVVARQLFAKADREMMAVMSVSSSMEPLAVEVVSIGGLDYCNVDMRNIFKHAILSNAGNIICLHNHPSGSVVPSKEDRMITEKIREAGKILDIRMLDHIIIGNESYYSFHAGNVFDF